MESIFEHPVTLSSLIVIMAFGMALVIQDPSPDTYYIYDNEYNETIEYSLNIINQNCGSVHVTKHNGEYFIFKNIIKHNKEYYCNIPLNECLENKNIVFMNYCIKS